MGMGINAHRKRINNLVLLFYDYSNGVSKTFFTPFHFIEFTSLDDNAMNSGSNNKAIQTNSNFLFV